MALGLDPIDQRKAVAAAEETAQAKASPSVRSPSLQIHDGRGARALEFGILSRCRTSEVLGARREEGDVAERVWTIPPGG